jgi:ABC-type Zn2+ transport system substrate-binding protein/surface adhesin
MSPLCHIRTDTEKIICSSSKWFTEVKLRWERETQRERDRERQIHTCARTHTHTHTQTHIHTHTHTHTHRIAELLQFDSVVGPNESLKTH